MCLQGELRINDNYVYFTLIADGDYYFEWFSNYDYRVYVTRDEKRVKEIVDGINQYIRESGNSLSTKRYVKVEKIELD